MLVGVCALWRENEGERSWKGKGRRERKSFKDQGAPMGATFSLPVTSCSLTEGRELTGAPGGQKAGHQTEEHWREKG